MASENAQIASLLERIPAIPAVFPARRDAFPFHIYLHRLFSGCRKINDQRVLSNYDVVDGPNAAAIIISLVGQLAMHNKRAASIFILECIEWCVLSVARYLPNKYIEIVYCLSKLNNDGAKRTKTLAHIVHNTHEYLLRRDIGV